MGRASKEAVKAVMAVMNSAPQRRRSLTQIAMFRAAVVAVLLTSAGVCLAEVTQRKKLTPNFIDPDLGLKCEQGRVRLATPRKPVTIDDS